MLLADITVILRKGVGEWESMNNKEKLGKQLDEPFSQFNKKEETTYWKRRYKELPCREVNFERPVQQDLSVLK